MKCTETLNKETINSKDLIFKNQTYLFTRYHSLILHKIRVISGGREEEKDFYLIKTWCTGKSG